MRIQPRCRPWLPLQSTAWNVANVPTSATARDNVSVQFADGGKSDFKALNAARSATEKWLDGLRRRIITIRR